MKLQELAARSETPVTTIKYYLRERLLDPGVKRDATTASYDQTGPRCASEVDRQHWSAPPGATARRTPARWLTDTGTVAHHCPARPALTDRDIHSSRGRDPRLPRLTR